MSKKLYVYFGININKNSAKSPAAPGTLTLGAGDPSVTTRRVSATMFDEIINFSYQIPANSTSTQTWDVCYQDSVAADGIGLPGHHGCGDQSISASAYYLG